MVKVIMIQPVIDDIHGSIILARWLLMSILYDHCHNHQLIPTISN